jgi:hypothetical protein
MNASMYFLVSGLTPPGALLGGALGQRAGFQPTLIVAALGEALSFVWIWCSPARGLVDAAAARPEV